MGLDSCSIIQFFEDKTILVTGSTGFLAKLFVEKILRIQPNVKKLYLLIRATDTNFAMERVHNEVLKKDLYKVLREKLGEKLDVLISEKILVVLGDISLANLGVNDSYLREEMWREINIVVNSAATTNFDERYDVSLAINALGTKNVVDFAKKCRNMEMLLHISTAYVCGESAGLKLEKPFDIDKPFKGSSKLDIGIEKMVIEERLNNLRAKKATENDISRAMKDLGIQRAMLFGWPNTYTFTKAMGEMYLGSEKGLLPIVILRPTIITCTYKEPFPGWTEGFRTIDSIIVAYGKGKLRLFVGDPMTIIDTIPADMVVNSGIVAIVAHANQPSETIYHIGSSSSNPVKYSNIQDMCTRYFKKNPLMNKDGSAFKIPKVTIISDVGSFNRYMLLRYVIWLKVINLGTTCFQCYRGKYKNLNRKIKHAMRLVELFKPYLFFKGIFDDTNTKNLRTRALESGVDIDVFYFDPKCINWENYFMNTHFPGLISTLN